MSDAMNEKNTNQHKLLAMGKKIPQETEKNKKPPKTK
jgi:hypothetical protein